MLFLNIDNRGTWSIDRQGDNNEKFIDDEKQFVTGKSQSFIVS